MKKMIWRHDGKTETVLFMGVMFKPYAGFSGTAYACIMLESQRYLVVSIDELGLTPEDYNRIFAE